MFSNTDTSTIRKVAALDLARHKMTEQLKDGKRYPSLSLEDMNEIFVVAGVKTLSENELDEAPDVKAIIFGEEDNESGGIPNDTL